MEGATISDRRESGGHCRRGRESFDILEKGKGRGVIPTERIKGSPALPGRVRMGKAVL